MQRLLLVALLVAFLLIGLVRPAAADPPYETRDAVAASALVLDARLGLLRWFRTGSDDLFVTPNLWLDFGLGLGLELVTELGFDPDDPGMEDTNLGAKWSLGLGDHLKAGALVLAHIPTADGQDLAWEGAVVMTIGNLPWRGHVNVGGLRGGGDTAWRASGVIERALGPLVLGAEVIGREAAADQEDVRAGIGVVIPIGKLDVRASGYVGITDAAPELALQFWLGRSFAF